MGKKIFKLFMDTMLRAAVIVLGIGVIIMLALLIKSMVSNKNAADEKTTEEVQSISTEEEDPDDPTFGDSDDQTTTDGESTVSDDATSVSSLDAKVLVVNATGTSGVAGSWKTTLEGYGYTSVDVGNYSLGIITTTKVCVSGDYDGADIAAYYTSPEMTTISTLQSAAFDMPIEDYDIVVVVGTTDVK